MIRKKDKDGGPAFPRTPADYEPGNPCDGMTLRDYFAGQALAGLVYGWPMNDEAARQAYHLADAMLEARKDGAQ